MKKQRILQLEGEGFFDITPDTQRPFVIKAGRHQVKVLGTSFNVKCHNDCEQLEVLVKSGKVEVSKASHKPILLTQDEFVRGTDDELLKSSANKLDQNYLSWYQKKLIFNASPLSYVLEMIEKTYHSPVKVDIENINNFKISTTFDGLSLEEVLTSICLTLDLQVRKESASYVLYHK